MGWQKCVRCVVKKTNTPRIIAIKTEDLLLTVQ